MGLGATYGNTEYPDNPNSDLTQVQTTLVIASPPSANSWQTNLLYGDDTAKKDEGDYNGKTYLGLDFRANHLWGQRGSAYWGINIIDSRHKAINTTLFTKRREDTSITASLGWRYSFTTQLSLRNDYSYTDTSSTLNANTYQRSKVELGLSYQF